MDITQAIRVAFDGYIVDQLQTIGERIRYRLQLQQPYRGNAQTLQSLTLVNRHGDRIPLRALVDFEIQQGQSAIKHYFGKRTETVYAQIDRDITSVLEINAVLASFLEERRMEQRYPGLRLRQGGEIESQNAAVGNISGTLLVVLVAIFFVMVLLFNSLTQPLMVMSVIPLGFAGVLLAFTLHGFDLSVPAMVGVLGLAGVLVNSAIVLIDQLNKCRVDGLVQREDIEKGAVYRLRPILITSLTTVAGLAPAAYGLLGSNPFLTPMIMAMLWGVAFGTIITLLYLPCLYAVEQDIRGWFKSRG
jgi:multidrug efflux pump subunit AcrB